MQSRTISVTKSYCIAQHSKNQFNSQIHFSDTAEFATFIFDHTNWKIIDVTQLSRMQNMTLFNLFILEIQPVLESHNQSGHSHFWPCSPKHFSINFWFSWICINMPKIKLCRRNRIFHKYGICAVTQQII